MNHTHPLEIVRPSVDYSYYERVVVLRQEARRLGMSAQTGLVESSEERASILASRIAEFHARQAKMMEAKRNLMYQEWRHPTQKEDVVDFSGTYVKEQLENAILSNDCERLATLVSRGAPPNYETKTGLTPLIQCVLQVKRDAFRKYIHRRFGDQHSRCTPPGAWGARRPAPEEGGAVAPTCPFFITIGGP